MEITHTKKSYVNAENIIEMRLQLLQNDKEQLERIIKIEEQDQAIQEHMESLSDALNNLTILLKEHDSGRM